MKKTLALIALALMLPAQAALDIQQPAPPFSGTIAVGGKAEPYSLQDALKKGPVVLYFYPSSFSIGCSIEAQEFAEALDQFSAEGATVVGVSRDEIDVQKKFSVRSCGSKFGVISDPDLAIAQAYDAVLKTRPDYANRISYVIAPDGKIIYRYSSLNPGKHVINTLNAVREWNQQHRGQTQASTSAR